MVTSLRLKAQGRHTEFITFSLLPNEPLKLLQFAFLEAQTKRGDKVKAGLATWFCLQKVVSMKLLEPDCLGLVMQINE